MFLPFTAKLSPWSIAWSGVFPGLSGDPGHALRTHLYVELPAVLPAFLAIFATVGAIRWLISGSLSLAERIIAFFASASMLLLSLYGSLVWGLPFGRSASFLMLNLSLFIHILVLAPGIGALIWCWRIDWSKRYMPVMSLQVVYVAHAGMWLIAFFREWQLGAYFGLVAVVVFIAQTVLVLVEAVQRSATIGVR